MKTKTNKDRQEFRDTFRNLLTEVGTPGGAHLESVDDEVWQWIESKKAEWQREVVADILECIENPQHKHYSHPKKYIKMILVNLTSDGNSDE